MKIVLLAVGKLRSAPLKEVCAEYLARLARYGPAEVREVKAATSGDPKDAIAEESARLLGEIEPADAVLVLDERGVMMTSREFSAALGNFEMRAVKRAVLVLGGAYGMSDAVKKKGKLLALSKMTLPHELCRALALEQLYRARTIQKGEPYHHD